MHFKTWTFFAVTALAAGACETGGGLEPEIVDDEAGRTDFKILTTGTSKQISRDGRNCDAQAGQLPLAVEYEPAQTPQQEQDIIDNLDPYIGELEQACASDPAVADECADLCMDSGCAWMPGGSVGVDAQSVAFTVGPLTPIGTCQDQSEQVSATVDITATCTCTCGEPLPPGPPQ